MFKNISILLNIFNIKELSYLKKWQKIYKNPIFFMLVFILSTIFQYPFYNAMKSINNPKSLIDFSLYITIINIFICCSVKILSELFFDKLNLNLLIFPLKPSEIFLSKVIHIFKLVYFVIIEILGVALLIYGVGEKLSIYYFINSVLVVLTLPFFVVMPTLMFILIFLYFVSNFKIINMKTLVNLIIAFSSIIIVYSINKATYNIVLLDKSNLENHKNLIAILGGSYYLLCDIEKFNIFALFKMILFFIVEMSLTIFLLNKFYYKTLLKINLEKIKVYKSKDISTKISEFKILFLVELKTIIRNSFLLINLVCKGFITPVMFTIPVLMNISFEYIKNMYFIILFLVCINNITAITSISRDKNTYLYEKILPINIKNKIKSKILVAFLINFFVLFIYLICFGLYFKFDIVSLVLLCVFFGIFCFSETLNCFRKNVKNPYLNYNSEKNLIVSNPNVTKLTLNVAFIYLAFFIIGLFMPSIIKYIYLIIIIKCILNFVLYKINEDKMIQDIKNL